jgi:hypothetical protein
MNNASEIRVQETTNDNERKEYIQKNPEEFDAEKDSHLFGKTELIDLSMSLRR